MRWRRARRSNAASSKRPRRSSRRPSPPQSAAGSRRGNRGSASWPRPIRTSSRSPSCTHAPRCCAPPCPAMPHASAPHVCSRRRFAIARCPPAPPWRSSKRAKGGCRRPRRDAHPRGAGARSDTPAPHHLALRALAEAGDWDGAVRAGEAALSYAGVGRSATLLYGRRGDFAAELLVEAWLQQGRRATARALLTRLTAEIAAADLEPPVDRAVRRGLARAVARLIVDERSPALVAVTGPQHDERADDAWPWRFSVGLVNAWHAWPGGNADRLRGFLSAAEIGDRRGLDPPILGAGAAIGTIQAARRLALIPAVEMIVARPRFARAGPSARLRRSPRRDRAGEAPVPEIDRVDFADGAVAEWRPTTTAIAVATPATGTRKRDRHAGNQTMSRARRSRRGAARALIRPRLRPNRARRRRRSTCLRRSAAQMGPGVGKRPRRPRNRRRLRKDLDVRFGAGNPRRSRVPAVERGNAGLARRAPALEFRRVSGGRGLAAILDRWTG